VRAEPTLTLLDLRDVVVRNGLADVAAVAQELRARGFAQLDRGALLSPHRPLTQAVALWRSVPARPIQDAFQNVASMPTMLAGIYENTTKKADRVDSEGHRPRLLHDGREGARVRASGPNIQQRNAQQRAGAGLG